MTKQETFDTVARHLLAQGRPAHDIDYGCRYRTADGRKCAAGCLIPDEKYDEEYEGAAATHIIGKWRSPTSEHDSKSFWDELGHDVQLVSDLQSAHDRAIEWGVAQPDWLGTWKANMRNVAAKHALDASVLG